VNFMCLVGSLLYTATISRPDIAYAVQALGRHMQNSTEEHYLAGKRILRYLQGTKNLGLKYGAIIKGDALYASAFKYEISEDATTLIGFADADWASDIVTRRSVTAYVYKLGGGAVCWASKLQPTVALSSTEAEYMAAASAVQEAVHLRLLMKTLGFEQIGATLVYEDNQGAIAMSVNPVNAHKRSKHIDVRFHFLRERVASGEVKLEYIVTEHQQADLLTKPLLRARLVRIRDRVLGYQ